MEYVMWYLQRAENQNVQAVFEKTLIIDTLKDFREIDTRNKKRTFKSHVKINSIFINFQKRIEKCFDIKPIFI